MKVSVTVSGDSVQAKRVSDFRGFDFRKIHSRIAEYSMENFLEEVCKRATVALNQSELPLNDYRLKEAIGTTAQWVCEPVSVRKTVSGSGRYHIQATNRQPDGYYISQRKDIHGNDVYVPIRVANLALVRMYPPKKGFIAPTGLPYNAPAEELYFWYKGRYHKKKITHPKGGHERYRNNKLGAIKSAFRDVIKDWK